MMVSVYPCAVRSIAGDVDTQVEYRGGAPRQRWVLSLAGPFCFWPMRRNTRGRNSEFIHCCNSVSSLLGLPATTINRGALVGEILVQLPPAYLDRIINKVYRKETGL